MKTDKKSKTNAGKAGNTGSASNTRKTSGEAKASAVEGRKEKVGRRGFEVLTKPTAAFTPHQRNATGRKKSDAPSLEAAKPPKLWPAGLGAGFTQTLAHEIAKNLAALGQLTTKPFRRPKPAKPAPSPGEHPILIDASVLIDSRILPIVNSGFLAGTLVIPQFILVEVQHIADSPDTIRRTKGRRGLEVVGKLRGQKSNSLVKTKVVNEDLLDIKEADHKLVVLAKRWSARLLTVDFNLAQLARAQGVKVLNVHDLAQALKVALVPGEEFVLKITHEGKERQQGVGYLTDGTMVVVDDARARVGQEVGVVVTKVHQTPAGQLFFARLK